MADQAALLLLGPGHEAGHVDQGDERDLEGVAEAHEARRLAGGVDVQNAGQDLGLVGHDADGRTLHPGEAADDVLGVVRRNLEEIRLIHDLQDEFLHVVRLVRIGRDQGVERRLQPLCVVVALADGRRLAVGQGQEVDQAAHLGQGLQVVLEGAVRDAGLEGVDPVAAELLVGDFLVGHRADHVRPGDVHVAGVLHHEDEVGDGRRIDVAAGAGPHDYADLGDHAGGQGVLQEDVGIACKAVHALLDAGAARVEEADDRGADLQRLFLDLHDLAGMGVGQRAAEDGEVLGEDEDDAAVDGPPAGDDPVAGDLLFGHAEVDGAVLDEHVELLEGALVQQQVQALPRRELALGVLGVDATTAAAGSRFRAPPLELLKDFLHRRTP